MNRRIFVDRWAERLERRRPLRADQDNPRMHLAHRDAEALERILVIDDRVPHHDRGSGDPRMAKLVAEARRSLAGRACDVSRRDSLTTPSAMPRRLLERGIEVALGDEQVRRWLEQRRYHYSVVLVSRASNIDRFEQELRRTQPQARRIYDIEALAFRRHEARRRAAR